MLLFRYLNRFLLFSVFPTSILLANPIVKKIDPVHLQFIDFKDEKDKIKGSISVANVNQVTDTMYFVVDNSNMYHPVYLSLDATAGDFQVALFKNNWKSPEIVCYSNSNHHLDTLFRTEDEFGIRIISSPQPKPYVLIVYKAPEIMANMPSPFKKGEIHPSTIPTEPTQYQFIGILITIFLLAIIAFLIFKRKINVA